MARRKGQGTEIAPSLLVPTSREMKSMWERFTAEGTEWEVRVVPDPTETGLSAADPAQVLEFRSSDSNRPPRRLYVPAAQVHDVDEEHLRNALRQARPIGGDFYGRPGKRMPDVHNA